ncbi:serine hydrolase domain-containing protein [Acidobacteriota bacterium]
MYQKRKRLIGAFFLGSLLVLLSHVHLVAFQAYTHTELTDKIDALFKEWDRKDSPGAALGLFQDGRIVYARGYGMANLDYNTPITPQSVFRVGSVSKQFTAMCIALLAEQGKIALDDDIRKYLPEMSIFNPPVTIRHMVHHTSGVRDYLILQGLAGRSGGSFYTSREVIDLLSHQKGLNFKPGDRYSYSNSGYFLLAEIVKRVSGMKTSAFARKFIFDPLGMTNTHFHDDPKMIVKNRATGYLPREEGGFKIHVTQLEMIGDGGIFTTIEDFFKWDQNFYENKLGKGTQELIDLVLTPRKLNDGKANDYAFGLEIGRYRGLRTVIHGGSFVGYRAIYLQFPDQKFSVVILSNLGSFNPSRLSIQIADLYLADQFTEPRMSRQKNIQKKTEEFIRLPDNQSNLFAGKYYSNELNAVAMIRIEKNELFLKIGRHESPLKPIGSSSFLSTYMNDDAYSLGTRRIEFTRSGKGQIIGFMLSADDIQNLKFDKIK